MNDNSITFERRHTKITLCKGLTTVEYDIDGELQPLFMKFGTEFLSWVVVGPHTWSKYNDGS